jgi:hypothetical protein
MPRWIWSRKGGRARIVGWDLPQLDPDDEAKRIAWKREKLLEMLLDPDLAFCVFTIGSRFIVFDRKKKS